MMRFIKTFVLRLYTDPEMQEKICGDLQSLPEHKAIPFKNEAELLKLLHKPMNEERKDRCIRTSEDSNEFNLSNLDQSLE
jgi:hypothetical protein